MSFSQISSWATCSLILALLVPLDAFVFGVAGLPSHLRLRGGSGGIAARLVCMASMSDRINAKLAELNPTRLIVTDDSHKHAGHAGVGGRSGETHYTVDVESAAFEGMRLVKRHQTIYALLKEEMDLNNSGVGIHALQIIAKFPGEDKK